MTCHMDLSIGLFDYPHHMAAGFLWSKRSKKERGRQKPQCLL